MFEVHTASPLDDKWLERDDDIIVIAGRKSDFSGAGCGQRDHCWYVLDFDEARALMLRLKEIPDVAAYFHERASFQRSRKPRR